MCGIVGILLYGKLDNEKETRRKEFALHVGTNLLRETQTRGENATGICAVYEDGMYYGLKMGIKAHEFTERYGEKETDYQGYLQKCLDKDTKLQMILGHCRKNSVGNTTDNVNNHPIVVNKTIGIHNGTLKNHSKIFEKLSETTGYKRQGEVDSEAIMALLDYYTEDGKRPFTLPYMEKTAAALDGTYSVLACNANNPYQVGALCNDRPMVLAYLNEVQTLIIGSEEDIIKKVLRDYNRDKKLFDIGSVGPLNSVVFKKIPNDEAMVFSLTTKVNDKTTLTDLYTHCDIRMVKNKYKDNSSTVSTTGTAVVKINNLPANRTTVTVINNTKTKQKEDPISKCMLKNKELSKFKSHTPALDNEDDVVIETEEEIKQEAISSIKEITLSEVSEDVYTEKINKTGIVIFESFDKQEEQSKDKSEPEDEYDEELYENYTNPYMHIEDEGVVVEVEDVGSYDASLLEIASDKADSIELYEDDLEMMHELDIDSNQGPDSIPPYALANKARLRAYRDGFYEALCHVLENMSGLELNNNTKAIEYKGDKDKEDKREKHIRTLKQLTYIMSNALEKLNDLSGAVVDNKLVEAVRSSKVNINSNDMDAACTQGDYKSNRVLRIIKNLID